MTNVKCDVQVIVIGPTASGKTQLSTRILKAIQSDKTLGKICKVLPGSSFEGITHEQTTLRFDGELLQNAGPKAPKDTHANIPGYPDTDKMIEYLVASVERGKVLLNAAYERSDNQFKTELMNLYVNQNGAIRASSKYGFDRVITVLTASPADATADPVGMDPVDAFVASIAASDSEPMQRYAHLVNGRVVPDDIGEFVRFDEVQAKTIILTKAELQSKVTRVKWAEGLIRQLPHDHDGRNSWLKSYSRVYETETAYSDNQGLWPKAEVIGEAWFNRSDCPDLNVILNEKACETGAPKPDAHNYGAFDTLNSLRDEVRGHFKEHSLIDGSILKGDHWVIFNNGDLVSVSNWVYCADLESDKPVYYTER